jgi:hypothetical protein
MSTETPQQGPPPPGYYQQGPPPKKSHTVRNVFLGIMLAFIVLVGGCMAVLGGAASEIDKAVKDSESGLSDEQKNDTPTAVQAGKGFTHDQFRAAPGWKVVKEEFTGSPGIENLRVTNVSDKGQRTALLTFRFYKGKDVLAEVSCNTNEMQAGERSKMDCYSTSEEFPTGYKQIKVADAF